MSISRARTCGKLYRYKTQNLLPICRFGRRKMKKSSSCCSRCLSATPATADSSVSIARLAGYPEPGRLVKVHLRERRKAALHPWGGHVGPLRFEPREGLDQCRRQSLGARATIVGRKRSGRVLGRSVRSAGLGQNLEPWAARVRRQLLLPVALPQRFCYSQQKLVGPAYVATLDESSGGRAA